jgi:hypothetical protein
MTLTQKLINLTPELDVAKQPVCHIHMTARSYHILVLWHHTHIYVITIPNARSLCLLLIPGLQMWCIPFKGLVTVRAPCLSCLMSTCYISQTHLKLKIWKYIVHFKSWRHFFVEVRFKVVTAMIRKNAVFWDVTACSVIENCQFLGNNQLDELFHVFIYFMSLHVLSVTALIIRRSNRIIWYD